MSTPRCSGFSGLDEGELHRHRLEATPLPAIDLADWSGIVLGGGPFNVSDPDDAKSPVQLRVEAELRDLAARVVAADFPFLGACYGTGTLGTLDGGVVDRRYGEPIGPTPVALTDDGIADPLFGVLPREFVAFLGSQGGGQQAARRRGAAGAVRDLPGAGVPDRRQRLRHPVPPRARRARAVSGGSRPTSTTATTTHPEKESLLATARSGVVTEPPKLLARFVELYAR